MANAIRDHTCNFKITPVCLGLLMQHVIAGVNWEWG